MLFRKASSRSAAAVRITATAFRKDRSAVLVIMAGLSFDRCSLHSDAPFQIGEWLRLHVPGQGWIDAEVESIVRGEASVVFMTECRV